MAETDRGWCLEGAVKPLPISLPFPTWIKNMQAVSLQLPRHSKQAVYTLLPSAPEPASWAGTGAERLKTLYSVHCLCLGIAFVCLWEEMETPKTMHMHIPSFPRDDRSISAVGDQRTQPGVLSLLFFLVTTKTPSVFLFSTCLAPWQLDALCAPPHPTLPCFPSLLFLAT